MRGSRSTAASRRPPYFSGESGSTEQGLSTLHWREGEVHPPFRAAAAEDLLYLLGGAHLLGEIMNRFEALAAARSMAPAIDLVDDIPISDRSGYICAMLDKSGGALSFSSLLQQKNIREILVTFIALLDLARRRRVRLLQDRLFGPILVLPAEKECG